MKNIIKLFILTLLISFGTTGCKDDFLVEEPVNIIAPENLYVNKAGFEAGLYGLYNLVRRERGGIDGGPSTNTTNDMYITPAFIGVDNAYSPFPAGGQQPERVFNTFGVTLNPAVPYISNVWQWLYQTINAANTIIDRAENPSIKWTETEKKQIVGEAKLVRAWAYRHLTFMFGDVPLNLTESTGNSIKTDWERTPVATVRKAMEDDLLYAETNLAETPPNAARFSRAVATHYLAELYLTIGDNAKAKQKAQSLVSNGLYKLVTARYGVNRTLPGTPFTDMFIDGNSNRSEGNTEALFVLQNEYLSAGGENCIMRRWWVNRYERISVGGRMPITFSVENGGRGIGRFGITKYALSVYGPTDERGSEFALRLSWTMNNPASLPTGAKLGDVVKLNITGNEPLTNATTAQAWPNTRKWDWAPAIPSDLQQSSNFNDIIYLRLAETYLLLAEAQFKLGEKAEAATTINALRSRAKATPIAAADVTLDFILDERSRELLTEEHRRYTLTRTKKWFERTKKYNINAGSLIALRDTILPIPQTVIDANLTKPMPQNPGY
ncbi:MAG: RagB/SusD family nutrient uptake outer membrane protein [Emticicia sp.]